MRIVWARDQATVREVHDEINRSRPILAYTTVMTVMARLVTKGLLSRRRSGRSFIYKVRIPESQFRLSTAQTLAQRLVHGYEHLAIASFVEEIAKVGPGRLRELQNAVEQAQEVNASKG